MGLPLYWIALILFALFGVVNFFFLWASEGKYPKGYFWQTAYNIDCFANREFRALWNGLLITIEGYRFGDLYQTLSEVLGHNYVLQTLTRYGKVVVFLLSRNHCLKAAGLAQVKESASNKILRVLAWLVFPLLFLWATPQRLRIAINGLLMARFGWLCNNYDSTTYLYIGMAFVFLFAIDLLWWILKNIRS
jgi:hypothetical protein